MLRTALALVLIVSAVAGCASVPDAETQSAALQQQTEVDAVCVHIMGLWTGQLYYPRCAESVNQMLNARAKQDATFAAYQDCRERDFQDGTSALYSCMLTSTAKAPPPKPINIVYPGGPETEPGRWFDDTSSAIQAIRERYACAQLGMFPGSAGFGDCVNNLHEAVLPNRW